MSDHSKRSVLELLEDIVTWGQRIPDLLGDMPLDQFRTDHKTYLAVWKSIEVVGEASGQLLKRDLVWPPSLVEQLQSAYRMRNRLSHGYPGVDLEILWASARSSVPLLVDLARLAIADADEPEP